MPDCIESPGLLKLYQDIGREVVRLQQQAATTDYTEQSLKSVQTAIAAADVGKNTQGALYVHTSALGQLPATLKTLEARARKIVGGREGATIVKFDKNALKLSYLKYPKFDSDPHPALLSGVRVNLSDGTFTRSEYNQDNPPILHRKELFVSASHPSFKKFEGLTEQEKDAGLLGKNAAGDRKSWNAILKRHGYRISGHRLLKFGETDIPTGNVSGTPLLEYGAVVDRVLQFGPFQIEIEYWPGEIRFPDRKHSRQTHAAYGHVQGVLTSDGQALKCYINPLVLQANGLKDGPIYRLYQLDPDTGEYDQEKLMIGYITQAEAQVAYLGEMPEDYLGPMEPITPERLQSDAEFSEPLTISSLSPILLFADSESGLSKKQFNNIAGRLRTPRQVSAARSDLTAALKAQGYPTKRGAKLSSIRRVNTLDQLIADGSDRLQAVGRRLAKGEINVPQFQREVTASLTRLHLAGGMLGRGTDKDLSDSDFAVLRKTLREQFHAGYDARAKKPYGLLHLTAELNARQVSEAELLNRLDLYANATKFSYFEMERVSMEEQGLTEVKRALTGGNHCPQCASYAGIGWEPIEHAILPGQQCDCRTRCQCLLVYRRGKGKPAPTQQATPREGWDSNAAQPYLVKAELTRRRDDIIEVVGPQRVVEAETKLQSLFDQADLLISLEPGRLQRSLERGRLRNRFETYEEEGRPLDNHLQLRRQLERRMFGYKFNTPSNQRPKYGFLSSQIGGRGEVPEMGSALSYSFFNLENLDDPRNYQTGILGKLSAELKRNTTITGNDSMILLPWEQDMKELLKTRKAPLQPSSLDNINISSFISTLDLDEKVTARKVDAIIQANSLADLVAPTTMKGRRGRPRSFDYYEAQVHTELPTDAIDELIFIGTRPTAALRKLVGDKLRVVDPS